MYIERRSEHVDRTAPVLNNFLVKLDGAFARGGTDGGDGIVFIATTNYIDRIDAALLRPGRFEWAIELRPPDLAGTSTSLPTRCRNSANPIARSSGGFWKGRGAPN
jgi:SpoVK/Ycf46/Vps4 family AAA+-type ATPase